MNANRLADWPAAMALEGWGELFQIAAPDKRHSG